MLLLSVSYSSLSSNKLIEVLAEKPHVVQVVLELKYVLGNTSTTVKYVAFIWSYLLIKLVLMFHHLKVTDMIYAFYFEHNGHMCISLCNHECQKSTMSAQTILS